MNNNVFVEKALSIVNNQKTLYVLGAFGLVLNKAGKARAIKAYPYNAERAATINAVSDNTFGFDCSGLIKGILWGFDGNTAETYGGAIYKSNGLPDINADSMAKMLIDYSTDIDIATMIPGEMLWMNGHCGIYVGNAQVVEATPMWSNCVQLRKVIDRRWLAHGKLPWVTYEVAQQPDLANLKSIADDITYSINYLKTYLINLEDSSLARLKDYLENSEKR